MAMRCSESFFDRLSEDMISLILHKLPFKTLVGCSLVSKYFNSLIGKPSFIYSYDANIAPDDESFISLRWKYVRSASVAMSNILWYPQIKCSFYSGSTGLSKDYILNSSSFSGVLPGRLSIEAVGSCNGLICLRECSNNRIILWNPRIMRSFIIPKTSHSDVSWLGFGFASKDNDYKVLVVNYAPTSRDLGLYSLKLNSWRSIGSDPHSYTIGQCFPYAPMVFSGGSLHYIEINYLSGEDFSNSIVAFDLENEVLRSIALPETLRTQQKGKYRRLSISEYNGRASIAVFNRVWIHSWVHEVWVMREYGVEGSWFKLYFEDVDYHLPRMPIFYFQTDERLLVNVEVENDFPLAFGIAYAYPRGFGIAYAYPLAYDIDRAGIVSIKFGGPIESIDDCRNKPLLCYRHEEGRSEYYFYAARHSLALLDK